RSACHSQKERTIHLSSPCLSPGLIKPVTRIAQSRHQISRLVHLLLDLQGENVHVRMLLRQAAERMAADQEREHLDLANFVALEAFDRRERRIPRRDDRIAKERDPPPD